MSDSGRTTPARVKNAQNADLGWRKPIEDITGKLDRLAERLHRCSEDDEEVLVKDVISVLVIDSHSAEHLIRRAAHLIRSQASSTTAEERAAWDAYAAAALSRPESLELSAEFADALLAERRKRFARKDPQDG